MSHPALSNFPGGCNLLQNYVELPNEIQESLNRFMEKHGEPEARQFGEITIQGKIERKFTLDESFVVDGALAPSKTVQYRITPRSRQAGLLELWLLSRSSKNEHAWAYIADRNVWVDVTMATSNHGVLQDGELVAALRNTFGKVEVYHSHPVAVLESIYNSRTDISVRTIEVAGSIPTFSDLNNILGRTWSYREHAHVEGIIGPLGVTMFAPHKNSYLSRAGPPMVDIANIDSKSIMESGLSLEKQAAELARVQHVEHNQIQFFNGDEDAQAFNIKFFTTREFGEIGNWSSDHGVKLTPEELARMKRD